MQRKSIVSRINHLLCIGGVGKIKVGALGIVRGEIQVPTFTRRTGKKTGDQPFAALGT